MRVLLGWAGGVAGLALVILIAVTIGISAAASAVGAAALLCALLLVVTGRPYGLAPRDVRRSGSAGAVRVCAFSFVVFAAYSFTIAVEFPTAEPSFVAPAAYLLAFVGCSPLASYVAWRSVRRNPLHPDHGKRPYFVGGRVPATRPGAAAACLGAVSLSVSAILMGALTSAPAVTIPLGILAAILGVAGLVHAWVRGQASRLVPVVGIVTGLVAIGMTAAVASGGYPINGIACTSPTSCLGVGGSRSAFIVPVINGVRGAVESIPGAGVLNGVACPTPTTCVAVGSGPANTGGIVVTLTKVTRRGGRQVSCSALLVPATGLHVRRSPSVSWWATSARCS